MPKKERERGRERPVGVVDGREMSGAQRARRAHVGWKRTGRRRSPRLVSTRGMKMNARPKAAAHKKGQQVDEVSGLSG